MAKPKIPAQIGRYQVVDRLGEGGMGVLYLASDPLLQRTVAIKVLSVHSDELRERFAREARSAASLKHNHIVTIYDVGDEDGHPFLAMEYVDGETMAEVIRRRAPLSVHGRIQLLMQLCDGLGYAHRSGIIHRDIKPANLMITSEGVLKILDFGLARLTNDSSGAGLTRVGVLIGTPHYMSPEQIDGLVIDHRSDIFAVGLVAYELLTYKKAYPGETPHVVLDKILHTEPPPLLEVKPDLDPRLATIVGKAIEKRPDQRYATLAEFGADLARVRERLIAKDTPVVLDRTVVVEPPSSSRSPSPASPIPNFEAIAQRRNAQISQYLAKAQELFDAGDYQAAIEQCEQAAVLDSDDRRVIDMLQRAHRAADDRQVAQWLEEAQALLTQGLLSDAGRLVDESLQRRPNSPEAQSLQHEIRTRRREQERAAERERAAQSAVSRARTNLDEGAFEAAIRCATEALAHDPGREDAVALKAAARVALEERQRREEQERRVLEAVANARHQAAAGEFDAALNELRAFEPAHAAIDEAIEELEAEAAAAERRRREAEEALQRQREAEEAQRLEAERRARAEAEARRLAAEAEERRLAEERRQRQEEAAAHKARARGALSEARLADAFEALEQARAAFADDEEIDTLAAEIQRARDEAEAAAERQRTVDQHVAEGQACLARGEAAAALRLAGAALELIPGETAAVELQEQARRLREDQRAGEQLRRQANLAASAARRLFVRGDYPGAVKLLEDFTPRDLVQPVLDEIHAEQQRQAQRRAEAERAAAEKADRERAEAAAKAEAERLAREAEERRAREAAERQAHEVEAQRLRDAEEQRLREAEEQHAREAEAQRVRQGEERRVREAEEQRAREAQEAQLRREAEERRVRDAREAQLRREAEARAARERAEHERAEAARKAERERGEAAINTEREPLDDLLDTQPTSPALPTITVDTASTSVPEAKPPSSAVASKRTIVIGAGSIAALVAFGIWLAMRPAPPPPEETSRSTPPQVESTTPGTTTIPSEPAAPPSNATVDAARTRLEAGDVSGAATLLSPLAADARTPAVLELIEKIRGAAANSVTTARARADAAGAASNPAYQDGARKEQEASALTQPADLERAVRLYDEAETEYTNAITAASEADEMVRTAGEALRRGDTARAVADASRALRRNPGGRAALDMLATIRARAQGAAMSARTDALKLGAEASATFKEAEGRRQGAEGDRDPRQVRQQIDGFERARELYVNAAREVTTRRSEAQQTLASARAALDRGDLQAADRLLNEATSAYPSIEGAASLKIALDAARRKGDSKPTPPRSSNPPAANPPASGSPKPPPAAPTADQPGVVAALQAFANAYGRLNAADVVRVAPFLGSSGQRQLAADFKQLRSYSITIGVTETRFSSDGTSATVRCRITREIETIASGKPRPIVQNADVRLQRTPAGWVITGIDYIGGGR
jgi:serine/threonine protein kinase